MSANKGLYKQQRVDDQSHNIGKDDQTIDISFGVSNNKQDIPLKNIQTQDQEKSPVLTKFRTNSRSGKMIEILSSVDLDLAKSKKQKEADEKQDKFLVETRQKARCIEIHFGRDILDDLKRRLKYYPSDYLDGFRNWKTFNKVLATTVFLYFSILLPTIAFSSLNSTQTEGKMGSLKKAIIGQATGGLLFALFSGQPLVIVMTTAPLCLYTKVIYQICQENNYDFLSMYATVGVCNAFFLTVYSFLGISRTLIKYCTLFVQEIFAMFIVCALITDAASDMVKNFNEHFFAPQCNSTSLLAINVTEINTTEQKFCSRETSLLFTILMLGTIWIGLTLHSFDKTNFLNKTFRELISSYALPVAIVVVSLISTYIFSDISDVQNTSVSLLDVRIARYDLLPISGSIMALVLGFTLSLLFLMDQNISAAMVDAPRNKLKKGSAYHLDLILVGYLNIILTAFGFPMMHGVLPHSPMHVKCLADIEITTKDGHHEETISNVRETRMTGIFSHLLIFASVYLLPYPIGYIPTAVLNGLFVFMALTSLDDLKMFERIKLLFTEQILLLGVMCVFGFSSKSLVKMLFPFLILLMIPFRFQIVGKIMDRVHLQALDGS